ncbi:MAG: DUF1592 domain-containing protein [Fimbriimonadaceae bacterium]|jgi:hypothetical protein|nr:DUF1592 domain-containing protein [Fimbriimonadaceae bacterium]
MAKDLLRWAGIGAGLTLLIYGVASPGTKAPVSQTASQANTQKKLDAEFKSSIQPLLKKYCYGCHVGKDADAGFDITKAQSSADVVANQRQWELVFQKVRAQIMPPPDMPQPKEDERAKISSWVQSVLANLCSIDDPGRVTVRRLNQAEYDNTVRDLLGVNLKLASDFPSDDVGYGFDNIGDVLSMSPLHLERYLDAAEKLAAAAIVVREPMVSRKNFASVPDAGASRTGDDGERVFFSNDTAALSFTAKEPGEYRLKISASPEQAGPDPVRMVVTLGGQRLQTIDMRGASRQPVVFELPVELAKGEVKVGIAFVNDYFEPNNPDASRRDRNLVVQWVELSGPLGRATALPESHRRIITAYPKGPNDLDTPRQVLTAFASRAYRRPAQPAEVDRLMEIYKVVRKSGDPYERAIQVCVTAVLVNPHFLFRVELDQRPQRGEKGYQVNPYELASRLSYFLWSSMPDAQLTALAQSGQLTDPKVLMAQVDRMINDSKANAFADNFAAQWLHIRKLNTVSPDPELFGGWNDQLRDSMAKEVEMLFMDVLRNSRPALDLITSKETYLNETLAKHYGIPNITGSQFRKVELKNANRGGLLGMAAILTVTSNPNRTSPVKRGRWVMEEILGTPPPPPPPNVGVLADDKQAIKAKTIRERMAEHRDNPACASCHAAMDAMGFSLENFNAVGQWRTMDGEFPVDASGEMPDGTKFKGPQELKALVVRRQKDFVRCLAEKLLIFATGRGLRPSDACIVDEVVANAEKDKSTLRSLIKAVVMSDAFLKRTPAQ